MTDPESQEFDVLWSHVQAQLNELAFWKNKVVTAQARIVLPNILAPYDPDPIGAHKMSDQRRLDTAFQEYQSDLETCLRRVLKIGA